MATNGYNAPLNGGAGSNGSTPNGVRRGPGRLLTVEDALPYSPFSSVVPFNSDIIPVPSIGLCSSVSMYATKQELEQGRQGLESLNREAHSQSSTSQRLEETLKHLKRLLRPEGLPKYKMKIAPNPQAQNLTSPKLTLTPLAQRLLDQTHVDFTYPSRPTPNPPIKSPLQPTSTQSKSKIDRSNVNHQAQLTNSTFAVEIPHTAKPALHPSTPHGSITPQPKSTVQVIIPSYPKLSQSSQPTPSKPPKQTPIPVPQQKTPPTPNPQSSESNAGLAIVIPDLPANFRPQDYEMLPESPSTPQHSSRKRRASEIEDDMARGLDQREKADTAIKLLRNHLLEIFEAEDQVQPGTLPSSTLLTVAGDSLTLSIDAQNKVDSLLQKVISVDRFNDPPLEDLLRLQKLCEGGVRDVEAVDVKVDDVMGESEIDAVVQRLSETELGLRAARTSLRLMSGGRDEKQLYSEEMITSALDALKNVTEKCIVPVVEMRSSGSSATIFKLLSAQKKVINVILTQIRRLFAILASLIGSVELSDTVINTLEFTAMQLIFVENAPIERESVLGIQKFDALRVVAMDVLAQIFQHKPSQRRGILSEILTSLARLPVTKQSARQYKLPEGGSIQLVSALIMRLVQLSGCKVTEAKNRQRTKALESLDEEDIAEEQQADSFIAPSNAIKSESMAGQEVELAIHELQTTFSPLLESSTDDAKYVISFIINRAMNSSKSDDTPYRNLLDLFVEDFIACLSSTEWPAAELLLRILLMNAVSLATSEKTPAPAKNMALDLLGSIGSAISDLSTHVRKTIASLKAESQGDGNHLAEIGEALFENTLSDLELVSWTHGPYRVTLEYLDEKCASNAQFLSSVGYMSLDWASKASATFEKLPEDISAKVHQEYGKLAYRLRKMVTDRKWLSTEYSFDSVSPAHARLAYSFTILRSPFCQAFRKVLIILLGAMTSDQATVRSKSLKSINQLLDTDPTILDRETEVLRKIMSCCEDPSVAVRDSALTLIGKCITLRPAYEDQVLGKNILPRFVDSGVIVRKRAMKLAKDVYLRNKRSDVRSAIAGHLLLRVKDVDENVQELARQMMEEVWMSPFYQPTTSEDSSAEYKIAMADHASLMVQTVQHSGVAAVLDKVLHGMLAPTAKNQAANFRVCKALVASMFDTFIDDKSGGSGDDISARDALRVLEIFAKSSKQMFTVDQVKLLEPYIANYKPDEAAVFRSIVVIFKHVLPNLPGGHNNFLVKVRANVFRVLTRVPDPIIEDIIECVWIISEILGDLQLLTNALSSSLVVIRDNTNVKFGDLANIDALRKIKKSLTIAGIVGKYCDLDSQVASFRARLPSCKGNSVSRLMCDIFAPSAQPGQFLVVRKLALEAIGRVCSSWPKNFENANVKTTCLGVFQSQKVELESIVLQAFKAFLLRDEKRFEAGSDVLPGAANDPKAKLGVMGGGPADGVALGLAQEFLHFIKAIAMRGMDEEAFLAVEVIASIVRQGLVHPKECGPTLIALETSPTESIANLAFEQHRASHEKHETILEKEYMTAVKMAYEYQRDIVSDTHGVTLNPFTSKLHRLIEVLKISKVKNRKRFYDQLCSKLEFPSKMDLESELPHHLDFSQFIIENMAFFEYATVDELLSAVSAMDKVVNSTGTSIQHAIETEIFHVSLEQQSSVDENGQYVQIKPTTDPDRLFHLTAISMMLSNLWATRTYLRRQYGLVTSQGKSKGMAKDLNRTPMKVSGITPDKYWAEIRHTMSALESEETMFAQCKAFIEVLSIDPDFKVTAEADEDTITNGARPSTPSEDEDGDTPGVAGSGRGRKRKGAGTPGGRKKRARSSSVGLSGPKGRGRPKGSMGGSAERSDNEETFG